MHRVNASDLAKQLELRSVLAIAAHPDDLDFGAAGTIAGLTQTGVRVRYLLITDGDAGGFEPRARDELAALRREEQRAAAAELGVEDVEFLGYPDGAVEPSADVVRHIVRAMRIAQPDLVIAQHPERDWTMIQKSHPDHLAAGEAVVRAIYPAVENPFAFPELQEEGHRAFKIKHLLLMAAPSQHNSLRVDITDTVEDKIAALLKHGSQNPDVSWMRQRVREQAASQHPDEGRSAELFQLVPINDSRTFAGF